MRRNRLIVTTVTSAAIAALVLAGCGSESSTTGTDKTASGASPSAKPSPVDNGVAALPATAILEKAKQALASAESFHLAGKLSTREVDPDGSVLTTDLGFDVTVAKGKGAKGTLEMFGEKQRVIATPTTSYFQGDDAFYVKIAGKPLAQALKGKWVVMDQEIDDDLSDLMPRTPEDVLDMLMLEPDVTLTKVGTKTIGETETVGLKIESKTSGQGTGILWIATTGAPYLLRYEPAAGSGAKGSIEFDQFNAPVVITPPASADVVPSEKYLELATPKSPELPIEQPTE